jgi:hypothetical protein
MPKSTVTSTLCGRLRGPSAWKSEAGHPIKVNGGREQGRGTNSLVVRIDFDQRNAMIEEAPEKSQRSLRSIPFGPLCLRSEPNFAIS